MKNLGKFAFYSPWHSVLYGVGRVYSGHLNEEQRIAINAFKEGINGNQEFNKKYELGYENLQKVLGECASDEELAIQEVAYFNRIIIHQKSKRGSVYLNVLNDVLLLNAHVMALKHWGEREKYEHIMSLSSLLYSLMDVTACEHIVECWLQSNFNRISACISELTDQFLAARCVGLFVDVLTNGFACKDVAEKASALLVEQSTKFLDAENSLLETKDDGVHLGEDRIVFAAALLLIAYNTLEKVDCAFDREVYERVRNQQDFYFHEKLRPESRASQLHFYLLSRYGQLSKEREEELCHKVFSDYINHVDKASTNTYLRASYLMITLSEMEVDIPGREVLASLVTERLGQTFQNTGLESQNKYDDDFFVYCYALLAIVLCDTQDIHEAFTLASQRIVDIQDADTYQNTKILNLYASLISE